MNIPSRRIAVVLVLVALLSACGGSDTKKSAGSDNQPDPCSLLTKAEAEQALGMTLSGPTKTPLQLGTQCAFDAGISRVTVTVYNETVPATELESETAPGMKVEGIGDAAYFYTNLGELKILEGSTYFGVGVLVQGAPSPDKAKSLGQIAVGRVEG